MIRSKASVSAVHPAILALRAEVARFRETCNVKSFVCGSLLGSDLGHDERAILDHPLESFMWAISPHATYMRRIGTPAECYRDTGKPSCYVGDNWSDSMDEIGTKAYTWDRIALSRLGSVSRRVIQAAIVRLTRTGALAHVATMLDAAKRDAATYADDVGDAWKERAAADVARWESERARVEEWGK